MATKPVCLALQGGGSHGAFTWGVLDKLLEDGRIAISAISGTSAGAMNAVVMAEGLFEGGREGAREFLERFWKKTAEAARLSPIQRSPLNVLMGDWSLNNSFGYHVMDAMSRVISPYQSNPLNLNPLADLLAEVVDFERVRRCHEVQLFISATNVETGRVKVFRRKELTLEMVLASACLPYLYQAVEIDGVPYWDGGYMGNPSMFPFYEIKGTRDIVLIQINPMLREGTPTTAHEITDRINEITFNASLQKDLRAIEFVRRLIDAGRLDPAEYRYLDVHVIENQDVLNPLGASSKLNAEWAFLTWLRDIGRLTAEAWLEEHFDDLGRCSTVDIRGMFQGGARVKQPD
ncbi:patatin-like phospholipase family protein [Paroceanicella profunda]|uniref:Patatin-like phospholipase family protein n=2 Tax=Paroceanicella profunda TaxID=2579971 RepID=A0A5B8G0M1_9RHOB|nr:patatin-like phospholipase family protein [Paroceanicella profunda]